MVNNFEVIDFHAHILPKADHGSNSVEVSRRQLELAVKAGVNEIIATPHFYPQSDTVDSFLRRRNAACAELVNLDISSDLRLRMGAEVLLCPNMDKMLGIEKLCIEGTRVLLIEMPFVEKWDKAHLSTLDRIKNNGFVVVIAHIERYTSVNVQEIIQRQISVQVNGDYARNLKKRNTVKKCMEAGLLVALGSDVHGIGKHYGNFRKTLERWNHSGINVMQRTVEILKDERL